MLTALLELARLYIEFSLYVAVFYFGRFTKGTDAALVPFALSLGFGLLWPWVFWTALFPSPNGPREGVGKAEVRTTPNPQEPNP
jgi:hypothetical protein